MPFDALICDLDGTLLNSLADLGESMNAVLAQDGLPTHPLEAYLHFVGNGVVKLAERALPSELRDPATVEVMAGRMRAVYAENWHNHSAPYEGVPAMLADAAARGLALGVLTNKLDEFARTMVPHFFPEAPFGAVAGAKEGVPLKPHPQAALAMAGELGAVPERCVFLGDTPVDVGTALAAGMHSVAVLWGFRSEEELRAAGARTLISHPSELAGILAQ